ncbi:Olfactory receptor 8D1 [Plecturocebus cupreus]
MAYNRYIAICSPLRYNVIMSSWVCSLLVLVAFFLGFLCVLTHTSAMMKLSFCKSHIINHYFCDVLPLLNLSCSNTHLNELLLFIIAGFNTLVPSIAIHSSHGFLRGQIQSFWNMQLSSHGCGDLPLGPNSLDQEKVSSVFHTTVIPLLNPLIYSLRNKDVKKALRNVFTIDHRIQHGDDQVIQDLNSCIKPGIGGGLQVDENHWHKGEEDGSEVGAAGGEGVGPRQSVSAGKSTWCSCRR